MPDFMLEPDEIEPERPERRRPVRLVSTGLAPTAEVPTRRHGTEPSPCYVPCEACGGMVLTGETPSGTRIALDTAIQTYTAAWPSGTPRPLLHASRAYPVHVCRATQESSQGLVEGRDRHCR